MPVSINSIFVRVANAIKLSQSLSTVYLQEFQIKKNFAGLYQQHICKSFICDRFVPVFINSVFERVSNSIELCRALLTVYLQELSNTIEFCRSLSTVYLQEFQIQ